jgi:hypothetical protein
MGIIRRASSAPLSSVIRILTPIPDRSSIEDTRERNSSRGRLELQSNHGAERGWSGRTDSRTPRRPSISPQPQLCEEPFCKRTSPASSATRSTSSGDGQKTRWGAAQSMRGSEIWATRSMKSPAGLVPRAARGSPFVAAHDTIRVIATTFRAQINCSMKDIRVIALPRVNGESGGVIEAAISRVAGIDVPQRREHVAHGWPLHIGDGQAIPRQTYTAAAPAQVRRRLWAGAPATPGHGCRSTWFRGRPVRPLPRGPSRCAV